MWAVPSAATTVANERVHRVVLTGPATAGPVVRVAIVLRAVVLVRLRLEARGDSVRNAPGSSQAVAAKAADSPIAGRRRLHSRLSKLIAPLFRMIAESSPWRGKSK